MKGRKIVWRKSGFFPRRPQVAKPEEGARMLDKRGDHCCGHCMNRPILPVPPIPKTS